MKILFLAILISNLLLSSVSGSFIFGDNFAKNSPLKKLFRQSQKTYEKFKDQFTRKLIQNGMTTPEARKMFMEAAKDVDEEGSKKAEEYLNNGTPIENPQIQLGKLAFLYTAMNRADFATATSITRICTVDNLLNAEKNPNVCNTYSSYLVKLIELRISVVTSRIMFSNGIIGIPKNWVAHVQNMVKDLEAAGMLSDSLKHLLFLLRSVAQNNEEVDTAILPNLLIPKNLAQPSDATDKSFSASACQSAPQAQRITIDARNLMNQQTKQASLDSIIAQVMPKMVMF